jgi:hypothetical protein
MLGLNFPSCPWVRCHYKCIEYDLIFNQDFRCLLCMFFVWCSLCSSCSSCGAYHALLVVLFVWSSLFVWCPESRGCMLSWKCKPTRILWPHLSLKITLVVTTLFCVVLHHLHFSTSKTFERAWHGGYRKIFVPTTTPSSTTMPRPLTLCIGCCPARQPAREEPPASSSLEAHLTPFLRIP